MAKKIEALLSPKDVPLGCHVDRPGSTMDFLTGDWRSQRPILDKTKPSPGIIQLR